ncbi:hypothetical protein ACFX1X_015563 [Malus domestica]
MLASILFGRHHKAVLQSSKPKLFVMGTHDGFTSVKQLKNKLKLCSRSVETHLIDGASHFQMEGPAYDAQMELGWFTMCFRCQIKLLSQQIREKESPNQPSLSLLNGNKNSEFCGPITFFDWNEAEPKRIGTSSIDTTCIIWDIEREVVDTQLIAHDNEVYDIAWGGVGVFASVSADGSVRVFDLRDKEHYTAGAEIEQLQWSSSQPDWVAIAFSTKLQILRV